ncbi:N-acetyltransferase [Enterococcus florum]|uniref:N-acetyltransferase n=1 Tax=Enterococcus florum TaxID=2480627 RepID=A0A4P5P653_9ENTE|nr:GNAT family N-acetyltransferase [Enterococcus florum]GCF93200.1 N-acetyltransferase [Enterococcus florum]
MKAIIRAMNPQEYPLLREFLYQAIFQRDPQKPIPRSEIDQPSVRIYINDFGQLPDDHCLCAKRDGQIIGAVWVRNIDGFGTVDDQTPEFAISLLPDYRGQGIGTDLMEAMLDELRQAGYQRTSLAVQKDNYALRMYQKVGFKIVGENQEEYILVCELTRSNEKNH